MTVLLWLLKLGVPFPNSSSELYNCFICHTIQHHLAKHQVSLKNIVDLDSLPQPYKRIMQQLCALSLKALENNDLVFSLQDIESACPEIDTFPGAINGFGLLQAVEHYSLGPNLMGTTTKTLNFIHFSIQEYLAAYQITCLPPKEELQFIYANFFSEFHSNTFALYVSMTKGQRPCFKKFLSCYGKNFILSFFSTNTNKVAYKFFEDHRKSLRLFQCFHEADDQETCKNITAKMHSGNKEISLQNDHINTTPLLPSDLHCLALFLSKSSNKQWKRLDLYKCYIGDAGLVTLHQGLVTSDVSVDEVDLRVNSLTSKSSEMIAEIATSCQTKMLDISFNEVQNGLDLSNNSRLETLYMAGNKLSHSAVMKCIASLRKNNQGCRVLDIEHDHSLEKHIMLQWQYDYTRILQK